MIEKFKDNSEIENVYNSELLLKILNKTSFKNKNIDDKELFVDENWKINSKNNNIRVHSDNSNLKRILSDMFPNKKIIVQDKKNGSQIIFLS